MIGRVFIGGWVVLGNLWRSIDKGHGEYKDSLVAGNVIADICNHSSCHLEGDLGGAAISDQVTMCPLLVARRL